MGNIQNDNRGGVQTGVALGNRAKARAEQVATQVRQGLPESSTASEEFVAIVTQVREMLKAEELKPDEAAEAEETIVKLEREIAKDSPNPDRVCGWVKVLESVSQTAGYLLAGAKMVKDLLG